MNASIDEVLRQYEAGNRQASAQELDSKTQPAIDRLDAEMVDEIDLNAGQSTALGARIAQLRASSRRTGAVLNALSAVLAATAAFVMVRILRRFARLMETRVSDFELFAGRVAHDIRSPLASVGLALDLTKRNPELGLKKGVLDRATTTLQRVGQLVDGLLLFARAGKAPEEGTMANVGETLAGVVDDMRPSAEQNGITLELEPVEADLTASCSPGVFVSLISNLLGNAIKFMGTSDVRRVVVRARDLGRSVLVEVSDTGPGVPSSEKDRIFDPYVRAADAAIPGIGLGLATVRRLAEAHGGTVGVRENVDRGSVFWFELPKAGAPSRRTVGHDLALVR
ncbi:sensor histidine kinase [Labilithrix luteola]|nr:HAMP domain-containing sensor histidine kinase [Labilithrix luteola]